MIQVTVMDWGVGGVPLLSRLRALRPDLTLRYRSDSGFRPWGMLSAAELQRRLEALIALEVSAGSHAVVVACNAGSTALRGLERRAPLGVFGVIEPGVEAVLQLGARRVGVVGGRRTILSQAWARPLRRAGLLVQQRVAQPLSAAIERGEAHSLKTAALVRRICAPFTQIERLVLACTHYPAASEAFNRALPGVPLVDPMQPALTRVLAALPEADAERAPAWTVVTSGSRAATWAAAESAFGVNLG